MRLVETLKLKSKLFFLFGLITITLLFFGIIGVLNINAMKKNIDSVYFGSLVPVTELNNILQTYYSNISHTIHRAKNLEINRSETSAQIQDAVLKINREWKSYESHFKRDEELEYIEYAALEIELINKYFLNLSKEVIKRDTLESISMKIMQNNLSDINVVLQKLIEYEVEVARYDRKSFLENYNTTIFQLSIAFFIILVLILMILYYVFESIQDDQLRLVVASKKLRKVNKKLESVSYTDALTLLNNRRFFNIVYKREFKRAKRDASYITFMMLDIDYFKQYNDTYGHLEGDNALKEVALTLTQTLKRPTDFVFRLGGEEFGVLLTQTDTKNSEELANKICRAVENKKIKHINSKVNDFLTISIGVVSTIAYKDLNENLLLSISDEMLYKAKENGRNRSIIKINIVDEK